MFIYCTSFYLFFLYTSVACIAHGFSRGYLWQHRHPTVETVGYADLYQSYVVNELNSVKPIRRQKDIDYNIQQPALYSRGRHDRDKTSLLFQLILFRNFFSTHLNHRETADV